MFHDKIYSVLVEVNEKTASKAIERLKRSWQKKYRVIKNVGAGE
jgi:hypothetical protein